VLTERGPSVAASLLSQAVRLTLRPAIQFGSHLPLHLPWPFGAFEQVARLLPKRDARRATVQLPNCEAQYVSAPGVDRTHVILYLHGGGFMACGPNTHGSLVTRLSRFANCPVLAVDYRMVPKHSLSDAVSDCVDAWDYLLQSWDPDRIVVAGDSAGGYLALTLAEYLAANGEPQPAGLALLSPLLELDPLGKASHPNMRSDAMFTREAFAALLQILRRSNKDNLYEPLDHITADLPPTLIHASEDEVLLHDAELAAEMLDEAGVDVELTVWPGQIHVFQIASFVPEANRSLKQIGAWIVSRTSEFKKCNAGSLTKCMATVG
jgi:acetyl esterase/lipase